MLFNSYIFIFIFLPLSLAGWYVLKRFIKNQWMPLVFITLMSLWFYGYFNPSYLLVILSSIVVNYSISALLDRPIPKMLNRSLFLVGLVFNLGLLFVFKYYDFFIENINIVFKTDFTLRHILLPLGISFFTFQQLSFIIDRYKGEAKHYGFIEYAAFVTFFPQLVAGPIVMHDELIPQFLDKNRNRFNAEAFCKGFYLFSIGLAKKVLLADTLALVVNYGFDNALFLDTTCTLIVSIFYTLELYFDFSGYSDMAIGLGRMFGIDIVQNFNSPLKSSSMKELWRRWHITLSRFFNTYVYVPLGGSKKGKSRMLLNILIVFTLSGIWHGANWTFVLWGILQGLAIMWDNLYLIGVDNFKTKPKICIPRLLGQFLTFNYFVATFVIFRSENLSVAKQMFKNILSIKWTGHIYKLLPSIDIPEIYVIKQAVNMLCKERLDLLYALVIFILFVISIVIIASKNALEIVEGNKLKYRSFIFSAILFVWSIISFSQVSTFIYFNF